MKDGRSKPCKQQLRTIMIRPVVVTVYLFASVPSIILLTLFLSRLLKFCSLDRERNAQEWCCWSEKWYGTRTNLQVANADAVKDSSSILEAAKTISLAFSNDPLIRWLRPRERPWSDLDNASFKWQQRRVRRALHEAMVLRLQAVPHQLTTFEGQSSDKTTSSVSQKGISDKDQSLKFGAIAIIERPQRKPRPWWSKVFSWLYLRLLDTFDPAEDVGGSSRVGPRQLDPKTKVPLIDHLC